MSKNFLTFAVVSPALTPAVRRASRTTGGRRVGRMSGSLDDLESAKAGYYYDGAARAVERVVRHALDHKIDAVIYFRSVMDGWNPTHLDLREWFATNRPGAARFWARFAKKGAAVLRRQDPAYRGFLPRPTRREYAALTRHNLGAYAVHAMFDALYDALKFVAATRGSLVLTARSLGASMDDHAY